MAERSTAGRRVELIRRRENIKAILKAAGVDTGEYGHATFSTFDPDPDVAALEACSQLARDFVQGLRPNIYLFSARPNELIAPGNGKTLLAVATMRAIVTNDASIRETDVRFCYTPRLFRQMQASFGTGQDIIAELARVPFLVLDDFGLNNWTPWKIEVMADLITERAAKSTFYTGNYSPGQMAEQAPADFERIASRLQNRCRHITLTGPDRRGIANSAPA